MTALPQVSDEVVVADFETELVVLVPSRRRAYHLDTARALVFDSCLNGDDRDVLTAEIADATGDDKNTLRTWVAEVVAHLQESGVLVDSTRIEGGLARGDDVAIFVGGDHCGPDGRNP